MGVIQEIAQAVEEMDWRCASLLVYYFIFYITLKHISNFFQPSYGYPGRRHSDDPRWRGRSHGNYSILLLFTHEYSPSNLSQMTGSGDWQREDRRLLSTDSPNRRRDHPRPRRQQGHKPRLLVWRPTLCCLCQMPNESLRPRRCHRCVVHFAQVARLLSCR